MNHNLEPLEPVQKMFQATNQTFVLILFILYEEKTHLLRLWFTVLVCTRCCLQKK